MLGNGPRFSKQVRSRRGSAHRALPGPHNGLPSSSSTPVPGASRPADHAVDHEVVQEFLLLCRTKATNLALLKEHIVSQPALEPFLAAVLAERLRAADLAPTPIALAKVTVDSLKDIADYLWRPSRDDAERLLRAPSPFRGTTPVGEDGLIYDHEDLLPTEREKLWVAARLCWFAGWSQERTAKHLGVSLETVKRRLLVQAATEIDDIWWARFVPASAL